MYMSNFSFLCPIYYKCLFVIVFSISEYINNKMRIERSLKWFVRYRFWVSVKVFENTPTYRLAQRVSSRIKPREGLTECYHWGDQIWQSREQGDTDSCSTEI